MRYQVTFASESRERQRWMAELTDGGALVIVDDDGKLRSVNQMRSRFAPRNEEETHLSIRPADSDSTIPAAPGWVARTDGVDPSQGRLNAIVVHPDGDTLQGDNDVEALRDRDGTSFLGFHRMTD